MGLASPEGARDSAPMERTSRKIRSPERQFLWVQDDDRAGDPPRRADDGVADGGRSVVTDGRSRRLQGGRQRPSAVARRARGQPAAVLQPARGGDDGTRTASSDPDATSPDTCATDALDDPRACSFTSGRPAGGRARRARARVEPVLVVKVYGSVDKNAVLRWTSRSAAITRATARSSTRAPRRRAATRSRSISAGQPLRIRGLDTSSTSRRPASTFRPRHVRRRQRRRDQRGRRASLLNSSRPARARGQARGVGRSRAEGRDGGARRGRRARPREGRRAGTMGRAVHRISPRGNRARKPAAMPGPRQRTSRPRTSPPTAAVSVRRAARASASLGGPQGQGPQHSTVGRDDLGDDPPRARARGAQARLIAAPWCIGEKGVLRIVDADGKREIRSGPRACSRVRTERS